MINNEIDSKYKKLKDNSNNRLIRKSAISRLTLGTFFTTSSCFIYSIIFTKLKKLEPSFIKNYTKGSFLLSFAFFSLNETIFSTSKYFGIYSNFFINYSLTSYFISKYFYRYLMRNSIMEWDKAIKYSQKCFLIFCVLICSLELFVYLYREIHLYDGQDIFDYFEKKIIEDKDHITFKDIEDNFMNGFHIMNSPDKRRLIDKYILENTDDNQNMRRFKSVNMYKFFRDNGKFL